MIILFSVLLQLATSTSQWLPKCGATQKQNLLDLINTDIVVRHFNSGILNSSLTECSNFHRHICPTGEFSDSASTHGLFKEMVAIERRCTKYDVFTKIETDFAVAEQIDHFDYSNSSALSSILFLMPKSTLIKIYEYTTLHIQDPANFYSNVWDLKRWTPAIEQSTFPAKYDPSIFTNLVKRKAFVESLAEDIKNITANGGIKGMRDIYLPFLKEVTDYNHIANVMNREGFESGVTRDRHQNAILTVAEEYGKALEGAAWSSLDSNGTKRYDRFKDFLMDIYHNTLHSNLSNIGSQGSSAADFNNYYVEEHSKLAPLAVLPFLRNFIAVNRAHARVSANVFLEMMNRWKVTSSKTPNAINSFYVWICVRSMVIFDLVGHNSPEAAVFGVMSFLYGHEMYHGVERDLYPGIMADSPVVSTSKSCVKSLYTDVFQRFPEEKGYRIPQEEEADIYGNQMTYAAFKTAMGSRIDDLAYPSVGITQRQLFFYSNSIFGCNTHSTVKFGTVTQLYDAHFQVNGRLGQLADFQSAFQCAATDKMVFPQSQYCPIYFPTFTA